MFLEENRGSFKPGWEYGVLSILATVLIYFFALIGSHFGLFSTGIDGVSVLDIEASVVAIGMLPSLLLLAKYRKKINTTQHLPNLPVENWPLSLLYVSIASA